MAELLDKVYDPRSIETRWYAYWEAQGLFTARADGVKPGYCIVIPPPNVTGSLHMGHALNNTLQDILIRYKRMSGFDALWMPGMDHAGIATQNVVERSWPRRARTATDRAGGLHRTGLEVEGRVRRHHHQPVQKAGLFLRLEPRAVHHGRRALQGRAGGLRAAV